MKVAVVSKEGQGKTCFLSLLAGIFAHTQKKQAMILSTASAQDFTLYNTCEKSDEMQSVPIVKVMVESNKFYESSAFDYGIRLGTDDVFLYDIFSANLELEDLQELALRVLNAVPARLKAVEIKGPLSEEYNMRVLDDVDAVFYLFDQSVSDTLKVQEYMKRMPQNIVRKTGYICTKYDEFVAGEKKMSTDFGIPGRNIIIVPYNSKIKKYAYDRQLDRLVKPIAAGEAEVAELRQKFLEIMQWLFDSGSRRYIKSYNDWYV